MMITIKKKLLLENLRPIKNIQLNNISFMYQNTSMPIFNQFTMNFSKGKTTVITGENGSGKTTLFNIICGVLLPLSGTIQINGIDIDKKEQEKIIEISSIISQNTQFKNETILECLENTTDNLDTSELEDLLSKCNFA